MLLNGSAICLSGYHYFLKGLKVDFEYFKMWLKFLLWYLQSPKAGFELINYYVVKLIQILEYQTKFEVFAKYYLIENNV